MDMTDAEFDAWREKQHRKITRLIKIQNWIIAFMPLEWRIAFLTATRRQDAYVKFNPETGFFEIPEFQPLYPPAK